METIFQLSNLLVMPFWLLMVFLPHWGWTRRILASLWVVVPAAILYAGLVLPNLLTLLPLLANPELATIAALLGTPAGATVAWAHFLAFDLFVGRWAYLDSRHRSMTAWLASPALLLILMVGPLGLLVYLVLRRVTQRSLQPAAAPAATPTAAPASPISLLRRAWVFNGPLTATILFNLALATLLLAAMLLDPKAITGVNGWIKPLKFALSIAIYAATFLWLLTLVQGRRRWVQLAANVVAVGLIVEIVLITLQVLRGTTSHFNVSSPLDAAIFAVMGVFISAVAVMNLLLAIWLLLQRMPDPVIAWGLRLGVLLSLVGIGVGIFMTATGPTPAQMAALQAGGKLTVVGAHSVGCRMEGRGCPSWGGAPPAATCGLAILSGCMPCRCCRCSPSCSRVGSPGVA